MPRMHREQARGRLAQGRKRSIGQWAARLRWLCLLATCSLVGCGSSDSVLRITLSPSAVEAVAYLQSQVSVGDEVRNLQIVPPDGQPISLNYGTSFTVQIDRKYSGPVGVFVAALDASNVVLLNGSGSLPALEVGELNDVVVVWDP